jgi:hypothetical protein
MKGDFGLEAPFIAPHPVGKDRGIVYQRTKWRPMALLRNAAQMYLHAKFCKHRGLSRERLVGGFG